MPRQSVRVSQKTKETSNAIQLNTRHGPHSVEQTALIAKRTTDGGKTYATPDKLSKIESRPDKQEYTPLLEAQNGAVEGDVDGS